MRKFRAACRASGVLAAVTAVVLTFLASSTAQAGDRYYLLMFAAQRTPNDPRYSHSFATFVRVSWPGYAPYPSPGWMEHHTISWLPRQLPVRVCAVLPEEGQNYNLAATLYYCMGNEARVSMWGPYEIQPELYGRALRQIAHLKSGAVQYKAVDLGHIAGTVSNCIHALSSLSEVDGPRVALAGWGDRASFTVLQECDRWIVDHSKIHPWVGSALGLDALPIIHRRW